MNAEPAGLPARYAIIGAQKARSTYLHQAIRQHPDVFAPRQEIDHFEDPAWRRRSALGFDRYFAAAAPGQVIGFKRPELLGRPECPARLARTWPDARLLLVLREPVSRTISAYFHYVRSGWIPARPLDDGLRMILDGQARATHAEEVVDFSLYGRHVERYFEHFDRSRLLVLIDKDLDDDLTGALHRVFGHLGLPDDPQPPPGRGTNEGVYSLPRLRWLRIGTRALYSTDPETNQKYITPARLRGRMINRMVYELDRVFLSPFFPSRVPLISEDVRQRLLERFEPDVRRLERLIDRPLPGWPAQEQGSPGAV